MSIVSWLFTEARCDAPESWQLGFQDPATPLAAGVMNLHHDIMFLIFFIAGFVGWMLARTVILFDSKRNTTPSRVVHGTTIEIIWTITPSIILMIIAVPSFALLYSLEEVIDPAITIKAIGHQWYWSYEYSDYVTEDGEGLVAFDSYMVADDDLEPGQLRLLEVDNRVVLPVNTHVRVLVTAADVLHCWAVPSLAAKLDAVPGRLNQMSLFIQREGVYYGQCSEICGINHAFMPIVVEAVSLDRYVEWVASQAA
jgi:cytochrome c oxidase subunit 2